MKLTKEECERRNCVFVQEQSNQSCVYPDNLEYGYSVVQETITVSATRYYLRKRGKSPFTSPDFKEPVVVVEERGDNLVRIKVIYLCNSLGVVGGDIFLVKIKSKKNTIILTNWSVRKVTFFFEEGGMFTHTWS